MSSDANNEAAEPSDDSPAPAAPEASADGTHAASNAALPSIIVDPSIDQGADAAVDSGGADASSPTPGAPASEPAPHDDEEGAWSVGAISEFDADRFADSLRPSWEVPAVRDQAVWSTSAAPLTPASTHTDTFTSSRSSSDSLPPPVLARGLDRRILAGIGAGVLVILVTLWSLVGGEPEPPPSWNGQTEANSATPTPPSAGPEANAATPPVPTVAPSTAPSIAEPTPSAPAVIPPAEAAAPTTTAASPTPTPPAPTRPKSVHVRISTVPASAELALDGDVIPNPFDAWVAESGERAIVASADGYAERTWSVSFDQDQTLSLVLKRIVTPAPRRPARPRPAPRRPAQPAKPRGAGFVTDNPY